MHSEGGKWGVGEGHRGACTVCKGADAQAGSEPGGTRPAENTCAQRWLQGMLGPQWHRLGAQGRQMGAFHLAFLGFMLPLSYPPAPHSTAQVTF